MRTSRKIFYRQILCNEFLVLSVLYFFSNCERAIRWSIRVECLSTVDLDCGNLYQWPLYPLSCSCGFIQTRFGKQSVLSAFCSRIQNVTSTIVDEYEWYFHRCKHSPEVRERPRHCTDYLSHWLVSRKRWVPHCAKQCELQIATAVISNNSYRRIAGVTKTNSRTKIGQDTFRLGQCHNDNGTGNYVSLIS